MKGGSKVLGRRTKAVISVLAVALLMLSAIVILTDDGGDVSAVNATITIGYYSDGATVNGGVNYDSDLHDNYVSISYEGIASTEYNPEYWSGTGKVSDDIGDWTGPTNSSAPFDVKMTISITATAANTTYYVGPPSGYTVKSVDDGGDANVTVAIPSGKNYFTFESTDTSAHSVDVVLTGTTSVTKVFGGWTTGSGGTGTLYLPGDVVPTTATTLFANWITPDIFTDNVTGVALTATVTSSENPQAMSFSSAPTPTPYLLITSVPISYSGTITRGDGRDLDYLFGTIYLINLEGQKVTFNTTIPSGTYRSVNTANPAEIDIGSYIIDTKVYWEHCYLGGDVIFDNVLFGGKSHGKHGGGDGGSIFAQGHILIMGTRIGVTPSQTNNMALSESDPSNVIQIYGGMKGSAISSSTFRDNQGNVYDNYKFSDQYRTGKTIISGKSNNEQTVNLATYVIIHSGLYSNVIAGSYNGQIGAMTNANSAQVADAGVTKYLKGTYTENKIDYTNYTTMTQQEAEDAPDKSKVMVADFMSTYLVLRGGIVADTLVGGGIEKNSYILGGPNDRDNNDINVGGTFTYAVGNFFMPGDNWEDLMSGLMSYTKIGNKYVAHSDIEHRELFYVKQASVFEGGCAHRNVYGATHSYVSDCASLWDVAAAGRDQTTRTTASYLEVTGYGCIRHIAAGCTNDGLSNDQGNGCVGNSNIFVGGSATVAMVFGGGYDVYNEAQYRTIVDGKVNIAIAGGTVGKVYGGGFRGSIGDPNNAGGLKVTINVTGGTIGEVYGGGAGGLEKMKHTYTGELSQSPYGASKKTTGKSWVYGDIEINVSGGTIDNVYGGGMSVPNLKYYKQTNTTQNFDNTPEKERNGTNYVASVTGDIIVNVTGGNINDSVYGGGKGIAVVDGKIADYTTTNYVRVEVDQETGKDVFIIDDLPWYDTKTDPRFPWYNAGSDPSKQQNYIAYEYYYGTISGTDYTTLYKSYAQVSKHSQAANGFVEVNIGDKELGTGNAEIAGSVYGGGAMGKVNSPTYVNIINGTVEGSVFGGGLGSAGNTSVNSKRTVHMKGGRVKNSVYGGSSDGDDSSDAYVVIEAGTIDGSVFGGGFMGVDSCNTHVYIGYTLNNVGDPIRFDSSTGKTITIGDSVFAGANVKEAEYEALDPNVQADMDKLDAGINLFKLVDGDYQPASAADIVAAKAGSMTLYYLDSIPYSKTLVTGKGNVSIDATYTTINMTGSVMGDGNSCLTGPGEGHNADITIMGYNSAQKLTGIHRADNVLILSSNVKISGKEARVYSDGEVQVVKMASLFRINNLTLQAGTIISIEQPAEDVRNFSSLNDNGSPTIMSSPSNKIVFTAGSSFYVRTEVSQEPSLYGQVIGYTAISVADQATYGAYVLGQPSAGGFVVMKNGVYVSAGISDFVDTSGNDVRCWYISGVESKTITMELQYDQIKEDAGQSYFVASGVDITKLQTATEIKYSGGNFVKTSSSYSFSDSGYGNGVFGLRIGNPTEAGNVLAAYENSAVTDLYYGVESEMDLATGTYDGSVFNKVDNENGTFRLSLQFYGKPANLTSYLGYVLLNIYEIQPLEGANDTVLVVNQIELRVDLYVKGVNEPSLDQKVDLSTVGHEGEVEVIIPASFTGDTFRILSMTAMDFTGTGAQTPTSSLKVAGVKNTTNTTGWKNVRSEFNMELNSVNQDVGVLSGAYMATLKFSTTSFNGDDGTGYQLNCKIIDSGGNDVKSMVIQIEVTEKGNISIFFHVTEDETVERTVPYGTACPESMCPSPSDPSFVGWYTSDTWTEVYNFSLPVTETLNLYARYSYTVTFVVGDGESFTMNLPQAEDQKIPKPVNPTRVGYYLVLNQEWEDSNHDIWDFNNDTISGDQTLYARWVPKTIALHFNDVSAADGSVTYGSTFSTATGLPSVQRLIGWQYKVTVRDAQGQSVIHSITLGPDTVIDSNVTIVWNQGNGTIQLYPLYYSNDSKNITLAFDAGDGVINYGSMYVIATAEQVASGITDNYVLSAGVYTQATADDLTKCLYFVGGTTYISAAPELITSGKTIYINDGVNYVPATAAQIADAGVTKYIDDQGTEATVADIAKCLYVYKNSTYVSASASEITAGKSIYHKSGDDAGHLRYITTYSDEPTYEAGEYTYEIIYTFNGATYAGHNLDKWTLHGTAFEFIDGSSIKLRMLVNENTPSIMDLYLVTGTNENEVLNLLAHDVNVNGYCLSFDSTWSLMEFDVRINNNHITAEVGGVVQPSAFTVTYGTHVALSFSSQTTIFVDWVIDGDHDWDGDELIVYGDCRISVTEISGKVLSLLIDYYYGEYDQGNPIHGKIKDAPGSIYVLYQDQETPLELRYKGEEATGFEYSGKVYTLGTVFDIYIKVGDYYYRVAHTDTVSSLISLKTIMLVREVPTAVNYVVDLPLGDNDSLEGTYGGNDSATILVFVGEVKADQQGDPIIQYIDHGVGDSSATATATTGITGVVGTVTIGDVGTTDVLVTTTIEKLSNTDNVKGYFTVTVHKKTIIVVGYSDWKDQNDTRAMDVRYGAYGVLQADVASIGTYIHASSETYSGEQTPGIYYNTPTYDDWYKYDIQVINGSFMVVRSASSSVTESITVDSGTINAQMSSLSLSEVSQMAKAESDSNIIAVVNISMGRRL